MTTPTTTGLEHPTLRVAVIGAGFGGLAMGAYLRQAGITDFTIFDKGDDVGGIWRDNTYPGCGCDVPQHLYSFTFEPYRDTTIRYPTQPEILRYLNYVADKHGLRDRIRLNSEVTEARWDGGKNEWGLKIDGKWCTYDAVVFAVGQLHRPYTPETPGMGDFSGALFHSARWDHGRDLSGRSVAVIGTGSSAAQLIPHVAAVARQLDVYQRTANWVLPKPRSTFARPVQLVFKAFPGLHSHYRVAVRMVGDSVVWPAVRRSWSAGPLRWAALRHLQTQIPNNELRRKLTPKHPLGCKRVLVDSRFYPALCRSNVELVTEGIREITAQGIWSGREGERALLRPVDTIIYATGFRTTEFLTPMRITGRDKVDLHQYWNGEPQAYLGIAVPNFPNLFMLHGPNTIVGHGSNVAMLEYQADYVVDCLKILSERSSPVLEVREDAMGEYQREVKERVEGTVWGECRSWYRTEEGNGKVVNPWPGSTREYQRRLRTVEVKAFR